MSKKAVAPKPQEIAIRLSDEQHALLVDVSRQVKLAQEQMNLVMACILAGEGIKPPAPLVREGQDERGRYLVVQGPG